MTPLHAIGDALRGALLHVPLGVVRVLFVATMVGLVVWVLRLPAAEVSDVDATGRRHNLRPWAAAALIIQVLVYALL